MSSIRIILQCRLSSLRLPGKALLPIEGIPTIVLSALRASNTGIPLCVAISDDSSDNLLADTLNKHKINYTRGPLNNVLERFVKSTSDMLDEDTIIRLTADNVFPDGLFLKEMIDSFKILSTDLLKTLSPLDGLPYGLSAEIFRVKSLRDAAKEAQNIFDLEHVTPWIIRNRSSEIFCSSKNLNYEHLRATIDTFDDYLCISQLFKKVDNPFEASWINLCHQLSDSPLSIKYRMPLEDVNGRTLCKMTLGAAQLGMNYGVTNLNSRPNFDESKHILIEAFKHGVVDFDTARCYGQSEKIIGESFSQLSKDDYRIITKLDSLNEFDQKSSDLELKNAVKISVYKSLHQLKVQKIDTLLLHRFSHLSDFKGIIFNTVKSLKEENLIDSIGVSLYSPEEAIIALKDPDIKHIQLPLNLLDWRWDNEVFESAIKDRKDVIIHARSVYLQGLLTGPETCWPEMDNIDSVYYLKQIDCLVKELDRTSRADLCIAFVRSYSWVSSLVIGINSSSQLNDSMRHFLNKALTKEEREYVRKFLPKSPLSLLNPSSWVVV